jgi:hypothetical protein
VGIFNVSVTLLCPSIKNLHIFTTFFWQDQMLQSFRPFFHSSPPSPIRDYFTLRRFPFDTPSLPAEPAFAETLRAGRQGLWQAGANGPACQTMNGLGAQPLKREGD